MSTTRPGYYSEITRDKAFELSRDYAQPQKKRVYALLLDRGKMTRRQIAENLNIEITAACARVKELMNDGMIIDLNEEILNPKTKVKNNLVKAIEKQETLF